MAVVQLETILDQSYLCQPIPHPNRVLAIWYCLTASEDAQRCMFTDLGTRMEMSKIIFYLDRFKYSMRYALDRIAREAKDSAQAPVPRPALQKYLKLAAELMLAGVDHALAAQICGALHAGSASASEDADAWRVTIDDVVHDKAYGALEMIGAAKRPTIDFATLMFHWIRNPSAVPEVVNRIAGSVTRRHELLSYEYQAELAEQLAKHVPQQPPLLPAQWAFAWGAELETTLLTNALALRCIYHVLAVHFGAGANELRGGGLSNILLVLSRDELIDDLRLMTSLSESKIRAFCKFLTWGSRAVTPDPALQPLIPLGSDTFAIPCFHLLSSDQERNLLSLLARTDPGSFNSQSHLFETEMIGTFLGCSLPGDSIIRANINAVVDGDEEEIDLIILSECEGRMIVCELRWMLGPGDPREVQNRKKVCLEKVTQLGRKVAHVARNPGAVAAMILGREPETTHWTVDGLVVIEGFAGTRSPDPRYPIIPGRLLRLALAAATSLTALWQWCEGLSWLPKEGQHFTVIEQEIPLEGGKPLRVGGLSIPDSAAAYTADALSTLSKQAAV
jgi:hypothetical protein